MIYTVYTDDWFVSNKDNKNILNIEINVIAIQVHYCNTSFGNTIELGILLS